MAEIDKLLPGGYTNKAFGETVGCSHSMASRVVTGKRTPSVDLIETISEKYGIPMSALLAARKKGSEAFGELMQKKVVRPANAAAKRAAKASS